MKVMHLMPLIMLVVPGLTLAMSDGVSIHQRASYNQANGTVTVLEGPEESFMTGRPGIGRVETMIDTTGNNWTQIHTNDGFEYLRITINRNGNQIERTITDTYPDGYSCTINDSYTETTGMSAVAAYQQGITYGMTMVQSGQSSENCFDEVYQYTIDQEIIMSETIIGSTSYQGDSYSNQDCIVLESSSQSDFIYQVPNFDMFPFQEFTSVTLTTHCAGVGLVRSGSLKLISVSPMESATSEGDNILTEPFYNMDKPSVMDVLP